MIQATNLWKKFGRHDALRGLTFSVPELPRCSGEYTPFLMKFMPDALNRTGVNLPFRDPAGLWEVPVSLPQIRGRKWS